MAMPFALPGGAALKCTCGPPSPPQAPVYHARSAAPPNAYGSQSPSAMYAPPPQQMGLDCSCGPPPMGGQEEPYYQEDAGYQMSQQGVPRIPDGYEDNSWHPSYGNESDGMYQQPPPFMQPQSEQWTGNPYAPCGSQRITNGRPQQAPLINIEIASPPRQRVCRREEPPDCLCPPQSEPLMTCKCGKSDANQPCACGSSDGEQDIYNSQYGTQKAMNEATQSCMCGPDEDLYAEKDACACGSKQSTDQYNPSYPPLAKDSLICMCNDNESELEDEGLQCLCSDSEDNGEMESQLPCSDNIVEERQPMFTEPEDIPCPCDPSKGSVPCGPKKPKEKEKEKKKSISVELKSSKDKQGNSNDPKCPVCGQTVPISEDRRGAIAGKRVCVSSRKSKTKPSVSFCPSCSQVIMSNMSSSSSNDGKPKEEPDSDPRNNKPKPRDRCGFCRRMLPPEESKELPTIPESMINDRMPSASFPPMLCEQQEDPIDCCCDPQCS